MENLERYFICYPGTPPYDDKNYRASVHYGSRYRFEKAEAQAALPPVDVEKIISLVNAFLGAAGVLPVESPRVSNPLEIDYPQVKRAYGLADKRDIVWMKFTEDGYLGVVASGDDINFDIPKDASEYDIRVKKENGRKDWLHNTSGILIHKLKKKWDTSFVLMFPLSKIPNEYTRHDLERGIGNYLIESDVPILDFYSHNYPPVITQQEKLTSIFNKTFHKA